MDFGATNADPLLTRRVSDDVNVVSHVRKRVGHLPDASGGTEIGWERTGRHHCDRVTAFPAALRGSQATHETLEVEAGAGLAGLESFAAPGSIDVMGYLR